MHIVFSARVGFEVLGGDGWLRPVLSHADWPLGKLTVTQENLQVTLAFMGIAETVPWQRVLAIQPNPLGFEIRYKSEEEEPRELIVKRLFLWHTFEPIAARFAPLAFPGDSDLLSA
ncbi:MAG: hypothetical protein KDA81_17980 [Planctomycetaceae bacterium]|nr:hypothetical protein [Planctomycetaceae bacterium]